MGLAAPPSLAWHVAYRRAQAYIVAHAEPLCNIPR